MAPSTRVLHIIDTPGPGGAETVFKNIVENLDPTKYSSFVILPERGWLYDKLLTARSGSIQSINLINGAGRFNLRFLYQLLNFVLANRINIIHSHLFGSSLYASMVGKICRLPVICTLHGVIDIRPNDKLLKLKVRLISSGSSQIVFVSNFLKQYFALKFSIREEKCSVIHNGIDLIPPRQKDPAKLRENKGFPKNATLVGSIGNIKPSKGYDVLLNAATILRSRSRNVHFIIAGRTNGDCFHKLLDQRSALGLQDRVHFIGYQEDIYSVLDMIDIFVLPSWSEGFSLATIESMNACVPVVATKCGGPEEIVVNYRNGILVDVGDHCGLAHAILELIQNDSLRQQLVAAAKRTVSEAFLLSTMLEKYQTLYQRVQLRK